MEKPELLAPVGNWTMLKAAIDAGADAIYFGVEKLNMRSTAQNFSTEEMEKVVDFCHKNDVKVHLTLNSIVFENELAEAEKILLSAKRAAIDMVICWDMSILNLAKKIGIPICLSTQASVSNSEAAAFYKSFGVKRIVLARECSLDQIKQIIKKTEIEIEAFVHGAMCISVSGRCFLSHDAFGKSANRGKCQQPCRSEYLVYDPDRKNSFVIGKDYILSPKDLCSIKYIDRLIESGICSFKIEGRKRSPEYVSTVVSAYREAIYLYFEKKLTQEKKKELFEKLKTAYNRGMSSGFYFGKPSSEDYSRTTGSIATKRKEQIGRVLNFYKDKSVAFLSLESGVLNIGDSIMIQGPTTGVIEHKIENMLVNDKPSKKAERGDLICFKVEKQCRKNDLLFLVKNVK